VKHRYRASPVAPSSARKPEYHEDISETHRLNDALVRETTVNHAPPTLKVTAKAFGIGRRYPIAQKFVE
jgi:hypothetical protein